MAPLSGLIFAAIFSFEKFFARGLLASDPRLKSSVRAPHRERAVSTLNPPPVPRIQKFANANAPAPQADIS